jgi:hypothetical protein
MYSVTHRSHGMQKLKFDETSLDTLFVASVPGPAEHEKSTLMFHAPEARDPQIPSDAKTQVLFNVSRYSFLVSAACRTEHKK